MKLLAFFFAISIIFPANSQVKNERSINEIKARLLTYPFNKGTSLKIVSFGYKCNPIENPTLRTMEPCLPLKNNKIAFDHLDEIVSLNESEVNILKDILLNTCFSDADQKDTITITYSPGMCHIPRNAIIFFDPSGKDFAYMEVCFACHTIKEGQPDLFDETLLCDTLFSQLEKFLKTLGLATDGNEIADHYNEQYSSLGRDNDPAVNKNEALYLNANLKDERQSFDFQNKKVAFTSGDLAIISKEEYFSFVRSFIRHGEDAENGVIVLTREDKERTGGYDAIVMLPGYAIKKQTKDKLIRTIGKK